jgi:hypothetical protein
MSLQKLGNALVESHNIIAMRPRIGSHENALEVFFEGSESVIIFDEQPSAAIETYLSGTGATAPLST